MNTTQTTLPAADLISSSRGLGRLAARTKVGQGALVIRAAVTAARAQFPQLNEVAFQAGFAAERRDLRCR
jgi:hypothetical protein